jgi:N-acetylglucosamine repressor
MKKSGTGNDRRISQFFIRHYLNKAILKQIFLAPQTRQSLIELFGVRPNTISEHINELLREKMIVQREPIKTGGRDLLTLKINNDHSYYSGLIIEGEKIKGVTMGLAGEIVYRFSAINPQPSGNKEFVENINDVVSHLIDNSPGKIEAICIAGEYFSEKDQTYHSEYIDKYAKVDFASRIQETTNIKLKFQSGIYSKTLAERWFGKGKGIENFVFFNLGTGVSVGIVHKNILNQGAYKIGGQLGHTRRFSDKRCRCGRIGCLETVASVWAVKDFLEQNPDVLGQETTVRLSRMPLTEILTRYLDSVLEEKNKKSVLHLMGMAESWAIAVRNMIDLVAPKKIILGGSMLRAKSIILPTIENEINSKLFPFVEKDISVEVSELGEYNGAIGAVTFLLEEIYDIPEPEYYFDLI